MTRITKRQNEIFKAHMEAWKNDSFDVDTCLTVEALESTLSKGQTVEQLWDWVIGEYVSITSQLIMNPRTFGHITDQGYRDARRGFRFILNRLNIR